MPTARKVVKNVTPANWGKFLRYNYLKVNFTDVKEPGLYKIKYDTSVSPYLPHRQ